MPTAQDVYATAIRSLPLAERLRLAAMILQDVAEPAVSVLAFSDSWSDEDIRDLTAFSQQHAVASYPEDDDVVV